MKNHIFTDEVVTETFDDLGTSPNRSSLNFSNLKLKTCSKNYQQKLENKKSQQNKTYSYCNINDNITQIQTDPNIILTEDLIGFYYRGTTHPVLANTFASLEKEDFMTLYKDTFIDGHVVDAFGILKEKTWNNVFCVSPEISSYIIGDFNQPENGELHFFENLNNFTGKLMMPYHTKNHWCLFVVDFSTNKVIHLDPIEVPKDISDMINNLILNRFKNFLKSSKSKFDSKKYKFELQEYAHPRPFQVGGCDCACFVMYFMDCIAKDIKMNTDFNSLKYRNEVADFILENNQDLDGVLTTLPVKEIFLNLEESEKNNNNNYEIDKYNTTDYEIQNTILDTSVNTN